MKQIYISEKCPKLVGQCILHLLRDLLLSEKKTQSDKKYMNKNDNIHKYRVPANITEYHII